MMPGRGQRAARPLRGNPSDVGPEDPFRDAARTLRGDLRGCGVAQVEGALTEPPADGGPTSWKTRWSVGRSSRSRRLVRHARPSARSGRLCQRSRVDRQAELRPHLSRATQYVVIIGGDKIVPFRRVVDLTIVANERASIKTSPFSGSVHRCSRRSRPATSSPTTSTSMRRRSRTTAAPCTSRTSASPGWSRLRPTSSRR